MTPHKILLADDHDVVLEGLRRILDRPEFAIVGAVRDGHTLVKETSQLNPDVIIVDVKMPVLNGIDAVREIRRTNRSVKIVFLSMHSEVPYVTAAFAAGASGYILKSSAGEELIPAVLAVLSGERFITATIRTPVLQAFERGAALDGDPASLSPRQREVLQLLAEGRAVKEIASILRISPRTVEFHKYGVMMALGAHSVADLTRYASKEGIV